MSIRPAAALLVLASVALGGCAADSATPVEFALTSPDIDAEGYVTQTNTGDVAPYCSGENISLEFEWSGVPEGTESFVLLMTDPAFPSYDHWVVTGIPGDATALPAAPAGAVTLGTVGTNSRGAGEYVGPCQPDNAYLYTLYALDAVIEGDVDTTLEGALELIDGHVLAEATLEASRHSLRDE